MALVVAFLVVLAFYPCLHNEFVIRDDDQNFLENPYYRGLGWDQIRWDFTSFQIGVYQPLAWMILGAEYLLSGMNPWGYHLASLVLYVINTAVLYVLTISLLLRCLPEQDRQRTGILTLGTGLAVAVFSVHPLRTEVVAWASCQPYLPCAFFSMLTVLAYLRAYPEKEAPRWGWLVASFFLFVAALLSKAVAVSLPAVLLILDVYPLRRLGSRPGQWFALPALRVYLEKVPFVVLSTLFMGLAILGRTQDERFVPIQEPGFYERIAHACYGIWFYVIKTVAPVNLTAYYMVPPRAELVRPAFVLSIVTTLGMTAVLILLRRRKPALLAVWTSYLVILAPNMGLVPMGGHIAADRYSYMAMLGGVVLAAALFCRIFQAGRKEWPYIRVLSAASLGILLGLINLTWAQCQTWRTTEALWTHVLTHGGSNNYVAHMMKGLALNSRGHIDQAASHFDESLNLKPDLFEAHNLAGTIRARQGRYDASLAHFAEALRIKPDSDEVYNNQAMIWATAGDAKYRDGQRAVAAGTRACELTQWNRASYIDTLASAYAEAGDFENAVKWQTRAIELLQDESQKEAFRSRLALYQERKPFREPVEAH